MGVEKFYGVENITEDCDFYYDKENNIYYLYLEAGNPGDHFENIEIGTLPSLSVLMAEKEYISII